MMQGGFNLHKWRINSSSLQQRINATQGEEPDTLKVKLLEVRWNTELDTFHFDFKEVAAFVTSLLPTKHSILRVSAKIFAVAEPVCYWNHNVVSNLRVSFIGTPFWKEICYADGNV